MPAASSRRTRTRCAEATGDEAGAVRTLLAEETRMGMLVGVAIGWELARYRGE